MTQIALISEDHSPAEILHRMLVEAGDIDDPSAVNPTYVGFVGRMPDAAKIVNCVSIMDTAPISEGTILFSGDTVNRWGVQLRIRSVKEDYPMGWRKASQLKKKIMRARGVRIVFQTANYYYLSGIIDSGPIALGAEDETEHNLFTINALLNLGEG